MAGFAKGREHRAGNFGLMAKNETGNQENFIIPESRLLSNIYRFPATERRRLNKLPLILIHEFEANNGKQGKDSNEQAHRYPI